MEQEQPLPPPEPSPEPPASPALPPLTLADLQALLKTAVHEAMAPMEQSLEAMKRENDALKEEVTRATSLAALEAANSHEGQYQNGVYMGRPDSARHVTIATRPVRDAPEQYNHPTAGVTGIPRE